MIADGATDIVMLQLTMIIAVWTTDATDATTSPQTNDAVDTVFETAAFIGDCIDCYTVCCNDYAVLMQQ